MSDETRYGLPPAHGLYRPEFEHDRAASVSSPTSKANAATRFCIDAEEVLRNMDHRGACGCEPNTGDGAGILTALPHEFLAPRREERARRRAAASRASSPPASCFCRRMRPSEPAARQVGRRIHRRPRPEAGRLATGADANRKSRHRPLGAKRGEPHIEQLVIAAGQRARRATPSSGSSICIRKQASHKLRGDTSLAQAKMFYVCSLSTKVIIYKGMLTTEQLFKYYPDLAVPDYTSHLAMVHSRFSTNTFPSWDRAQPMRFMSHNGEINTLRGNMNWMQARARRRRRASCSATNSRSCSRSPSPIAATRACSTTCWSSCCMSGRTLPGIRDDDDSRGVAEPRIDVGGQAGVLRVPLVPDGAVGRPGVDRVHRRQVHRRRARPQRPAAHAAITSRTTTA